MKAILGIFLLSIVTVAVASEFALKPTKCIDPRVVMVQCEEGTVFKGWNYGSCKNGLVEGPICSPKCFDPRSVMIACKEGTEFKGWNYGICENGLVEGPICE